MPYYVHPQEMGIDELRSQVMRETCEIPWYPSKVEAHENRGEGMITFLPSYSESRNWQRREQERFTSGLYIQVPWSEFMAYGDSMYALYPHLSLKTPGLIAYTKDEEHGLLDRQTAIRPGRFIDQFKLMDLYGWNTDTRDRMIAECGPKHLELKIARSADDIEKIYCAEASFSSCMDGRHWEEGQFKSTIHPVRVYGDSDLALAYFGDMEHPKARCIIWPEKKIYTRCYGNGHALERLLKEAGYSKGTAEGARVKAIEDKGTWLMPYVDAVEYATLGRGKDHGWIILSNEGGLSTCRTDGLAEACMSGTCAHCEADCDEDESYCEDCSNQFASCYNCGNEIWTNEDDHYVRIYSGEPYCESCANDRSRTCERCQETWLEETLSRGTRSERRDAGIAEHLCYSCGLDHRVCENGHIHDKNLNCPYCEKEEESCQNEAPTSTT
jgi:hypothetical protein